MISRKKNNNCGISVKRLYGYPTVLKIGRENKETMGQEQDLMSRDWNPEDPKSFGDIREL
jgi:hypothetical protein